MEETDDPLLEAEYTDERGKSGTAASPPPRIPSSTASSASALRPTILPILSKRL